MSLTINTNHAAVQAGFNLSRNSNSLQESINRLSSGKRINRPADDSGGLSVSMKLRSSINRLNGANNNIQNGVSFLEVQDGVLGSRRSDRRPNDRTQGNESGRHEEQLRQRDLRERVPRSSNSGARHGSADLQRRKFVRHDDSQDQISQAVFNNASLDNTVSVFVSADGSTGAKVSLNKATLLSALTINSNTLASTDFASADNSANAAGAIADFTFAAVDSGSNDEHWAACRWASLIKLWRT